MSEEELELIMRRRSIRAYQNKPVEPEKLDLILRAAMAAPSACNTQPWEFIVVQGEETLAKIREALPMARYHAPCAVVVCGNTNLSRNTKSMWEQDCCAATQNILLAATALALGSVWIGVYGVEPFVNKVTKIFELPKHVLPLAIVYLGYADEHREPRNQYNEKRVYRETYDPNRKHRVRPKNLKKK